MAALTLAMIGTLALGFMAGREYDRGIKRVQKNRELRRREQEKKRLMQEAKMEDARVQKELEAERRKNEFIASIYYRNPNCKGAVD